jgi:hypothetical protein
MKFTKIMVDMDGVLCNFEKRYNELFGNVPDGERRTKFHKNFIEFINGNNFATLEPMPDFLVLKKYLENLNIPKQILSSTATIELKSKIEPQKIHWLHEHFVLWDTPIFVPGKQYKYLYATPESIIIDDTYSVIEDWRKAGGTAIHHKDAKSTIAELHNLLKFA